MKFWGNLTCILHFLAKTLFDAGKVCLIRDLEEIKHFVVEIVAENVLVLDFLLVAYFLCCDQGGTVLRKLMW